jgi:hypothetical protein
MSICLDPLFLQARRISLWYIVIVTVEPVCISRTGKVPQRGTVCPDTAAYDNVEYIHGRRSKQCQGHGEEEADSCYRKVLGKCESIVHDVVLEVMHIALDTRMVVFKAKS